MSDSALTRNQLGWVLQAIEVRGTIKFSSHFVALTGGNEKLALPRCLMARSAMGTMSHVNNWINTIVLIKFVPCGYILRNWLLIVKGPPIIEVPPFLTPIHFNNVCKILHCLAKVTDEKIIGWFIILNLFSNKKLVIATRFILSNNTLFYMILNYFFLLTRKNIHFFFCLICHNTLFQSFRKLSFYLLVFKLDMWLNLYHLAKNIFQNLYIRSNIRSSSWLKRLLQCLKQLNISYFFVSYAHYTHIHTFIFLRNPE